jgi:nucleotidyltransferase substrate binding protein (TIGR01987 family)
MKKWNASYRKWANNQANAKETTMSLEAETQDLTTLEKSLAAFDTVYPRALDDTWLSQQDEATRLAFAAGVIKHFEFTYELCWKAMKRWLNDNVSPEITDGISRRELFRLAAQYRLIGDVEEWMVYHMGRNQTAHRYGQVMADEVAQILPDFSHAAHQLYQQLAQKQAND